MESPLTPPDLAAGASPTSGAPPLRLFVSWAQAGIMITFGVGLVFGAVLLGVTTWALRPGTLLQVGLAATILLLVWIGLGYVTNALAMRRRPVFELFDDRLVCHDLEGTYVVALAAVERATLDARRGIPALVVEAEGRRITIPASLTGSAAAFARLEAAAAAAAGREAAR